MSWDRTGALQGELATGWAVEDGAWVFRLRRDARFHNGEPVTAEDVRWTIEQVAGEHSTAYMRSQFQGLSRVETPDPFTVRLVTKDPVATLPSWFANYNMAVCWHGSDPRQPVGCGPFRLAGQERGISVTLEASANYYKPGLPKLKAVGFLVYADESLRTAALQAGDLDMIEYVPWQAMGAVAADARLKLDEVAGGAFMDLLFNFHLECGARPISTRCWRVAGTTTRPAPARCWRRPGMPTGSRPRCSRRRSTPCTRIRRWWCSNTWRRSASRRS